MAEGGLVKCIDCGHSISRSAHRCPKCNSGIPHGVQCCFCKALLKSGDAIHWRSYYSHRECFETLFAVPPDLACPDCGHTFPFTWLLDEGAQQLDPGPLVRLRPCPECGHDNPLGGVSRCAFCYLFMFDSFQELERWESGAARCHSRCLVARHSRSPAPRLWQAWLAAPFEIAGYLVSAVICGFIGSLAGFAVGCTVDLFRDDDTATGAMFLVGLLIGIVLGIRSFKTRYTAPVD